MIIGQNNELDQGTEQSNKHEISNTEENFEIKMEHI